MELHYLVPLVKGIALYAALSQATTRQWQAFALANALKSELRQQKMLFTLMIIALCVSFASRAY
jgi:hypothetical protein